MPDLSAKIEIILAERRLDFGYNDFGKYIRRLS